jgi:hypothetical protein
MAALSVSEAAPDRDLFDGLTRTEALQLCVRRSFNLSHAESDFIRRMLALKKPMRSDEIVRLRGMVIRLRDQRDIEEYAGASA